MTQTVEQIETPAELRVGQVQWHSSEEDGGPDVGILMRIDADHLLWLGDTPEVDTGSCGIVIYGPNKQRHVAELTYDDLREVFEEFIAPALARSSERQSMTQAPAADIVERLLWSMEPNIDALRNEAATEIEALRAREAEQEDAWAQVGYWKEKAEQAERNRQALSDKYLPKYQASLARTAELQRKLDEAVKALLTIRQALRASKLQLREHAADTLASIRGEG